MSGRVPTGRVPNPRKLTGTAVITPDGDHYRAELEYPSEYMGKGYSTPGGVTRATYIGPLIEMQRIARNMGCRVVMRKEQARA